MAQTDQAEQTEQTDQAEQAEQTDQAKALFGRLSRVDLGDWGAERIGAAAADLGWEPDDAVKPTRLDTGLATGPAIVVPTPQEDAGGDVPRAAALRVPVGPAGAFAGTVEAATALMGFGPPMIGGPGPWVRWRRPPGADAGAGTSIGLLRADERVWVELVATQTWESQARRWFADGEGIEELPYRWLASRRHPTLQGLTTGGRLVAGWDAVEQGLTLTLDELLDGVDALARPGASGPTGTVRLARQDRSPTAFFDVVLSPGRALTFRRAGGPALGEQGWHRQDKRTWLCEWPAAGPDECAEAARIAVRTLRESLHCRLPADAVCARTKLAGRTDVELPGFGLARARATG